VVGGDREQHVARRAARRRGLDQPGKLGVGVGERSGVEPAQAVLIGGARGALPHVDRPQRVGRAVDA
jgi:hypothetical protein